MERLSKESFLRFAARKEVVAEPVTTEQLDAVIQLVEAPPEESIEYAQEQIEVFKEDGLADQVAEEKTLDSFVEGGNVPATIAMLHVQEADTLTKIDMVVKAYDHQIDIFKAEDKQIDPFFKDPVKVQRAELQKNLFEQARNYYAETIAPLTIQSADHELAPDSPRFLQPRQTFSYESAAGED